MTEILAVGESAARDYRLPLGRTLSSRGSSSWVRASAATRPPVNLSPENSQCAGTTPGQPRFGLASAIRRLTQMRKLTILTLWLAILPLSAGSHESAPA